MTIAQPGVDAAHHRLRHQDAGTDEIILTGLSGDPADTINESLLTTQNDMIVRGATIAERLNITASKIVARLASGNIVAATIGEILNLLFTTQNDIIVRGATIAERLNITASTIVARLASGNVVAATISQILNLLFTTQDDIIVRGAADAERLNITEQTLVGRITSGHLAALTAAEIITLLGGVDRTLLFNTFRYMSSWIASPYGAYLPAGNAACSCYLPLSGLKVGDVIKSYNLLGYILEGGGDTVTLDCKLVELSQAGGTLVLTDITNGAITQVDANGLFDATCNCDDTTVVTDKQYHLKLEGTTSNVSGSEVIYVTGAEVVITRLV